MNPTKSGNYLTWNIRGQVFSFDTPKVMGILNITPDSFYTGSRQTTAGLVSKAGQMLHDGASFLDVGGVSTRPGATHLTADDEMNRVIPAIRSLVAAFPQANISVDTYHGKVAQAAVGEGACMINDISAGTFDPDMWPMVEELRVPYILMFIRGTFETMHEKVVSTDIVGDAMRFFSSHMLRLRKSGLSDIAVDPGFGFGKTLDDNYRLLAHLSDFQSLGIPLLAGLSRKKMIQSVVGTDSEGALNGSSSAHMLALAGGASILRVHDVREATECIRIYEQWNKSR